MTRFLIILLFSFFAKLSNGQVQINLKLKNELDSIYQLDQKYRELIFSESLKSKSDSIAKSFGLDNSQLLQNFLMTEMKSVDSSNIIRIEQLLKKFGYPGKTLVGEPTNEAVFYVIQHSQDIDKYLSVVKKAAINNELPFRLYAMMLDRSLMYNGKEQIYGTQGKGFKTLNKSTNQNEFIMVIWPIKNYKKVNKRRKKAGFKDTVEENSKRIGIDYKTYTIEQINKMKVE